MDRQQLIIVGAGLFPPVEAEPASLAGTDIGPGEVDGLQLDTQLFLLCLFSNELFEEFRRPGAVPPPPGTSADDENLAAPLFTHN